MMVRSVTFVSIGRPSIRRASTPEQCSLLPSRYCAPTLAGGYVDLRQQGGDSTQSSVGNFGSVDGSPVPIQRVVSTRWRTVNGDGS